MMKTLILMTFALLVMSGCAKYDDTRAAANLQVPPYTETGANTFGCLLNGKVWANFGAEVSGAGFGIHPAAPDLVTSYISGNSSGNLFHTGSDTIFSVNGKYSLVKKGTELREEFMTIILPKNGSLKGYHMLTGTNGTFHYERILSLEDYTSQARNPFTVVVNKDSLVNNQYNGFHHIVSGRFYGTLYNKAGTDSVIISAGVFDTVTSN